MCERKVKKDVFLVQYACLELCRLIPSCWPCQVGAGLFTTLSIQECLLRSNLSKSSKEH